jgi:hypothetical protein
VATSKDTPNVSQLDPFALGDECCQIVAFIEGARVMARELFEDPDALGPVNVNRLLLEATERLQKVVTSNG